MTDRLLLPLFLLALGGPVGAQALPPEEAEAPESLFDQKIGDVGVVLEADGTWTTRLAGGWGQGFSPQGALPGLGYPGFEKGGVFSQQPDFSLTLRLLERYYLEVVYSGSLEDRTFLIGYQGKPGEILQWAKAGNTPFAVPSRAGQSLAEGRRGAPAAGAALTLGPVTTEILGRYEDGSRETRSYRGYRETSAATVAVDQWIRGRFFQIPDTKPLTGLRVLVADPNGTVSVGAVAYREATGSEVVVDPTTGAIRLAAEANRRFLVTWDTAAAWVGSSPTSLLGLSPETAVAGADTWVVLVQPGSPSVLEERNRYPLPLGTQGAVTLVDQDSGLPVPGYTVGQSTVQDWFEVSGQGEAPFLDTLPGIYPHGPGQVGFPPPASTLPWVFRLSPPAAPSSYSLGQDVLPASVIVVRNGIPTDSFRFDAGAGTLRLDSPVFETDQIEISFQRTKTGSKASDLVGWQGGRWDLGPDHAVEWAVQGRWNMEQGRYTTEDLQSPGKMALSVSYQGKLDDWSWKLAATAGALMTDSTGRRRLYGLASDGTQAQLNGDALRPSAVPQSLGLGEPGRAALVYRDFWTNDPLTGTPQVSAWGNASVPAEPSVVDGWVGPYMVRGDGVRTDRLAVLEADMAAGQWAAFQTFLDSGKPRDLKAASAISVDIRVPGGLDADDKLYLQAGTLSEDWDGTGAVRQIEYRSVPALLFQDANRGSRYFPVPESSTWGNDTGDGTAGQDGSLVTRELTALTDLDRNSRDWQRVRFLLGDEERQRLRRTTGWRLVLVEGSTTATRTVLVGPVVFEGSGWTVVADQGATSGSVNPVQQVDPDDAERQQLRVDWTSRSDWSIEGRHSPLRPGSYRSLTFRYKLSVPSGSTTLKLSVTDANGRGVVAEWPALSGSGWVEGKIDLRDKSLSLDGQRTGTVTITPGAATWDRATLTKGDTSSSGTLVLAEVEATDPVWEPLGTSLASVQWRQAGAWPSSEWPLFSGMAWSGTSNQSGLTDADLVWRGETSLAGSVGPVVASGQATFVRSAETLEGHGSYVATLPLGWAGGPKVEWTDRFSDQGLRSEKVVLVLPWVGTWEAAAQAKGPPRSLDQDYNLGWTSPGPASGWETAAEARWSQSRPRDTSLVNFSQTWMDSWSWLPPATETAPFYLLQAQIESKATWGPWSVALKGHNQASQSLGTEPKWTAWGDWEARLPYRSGQSDSWTLTPSVSKSAEAVYSGRASLAPVDSARQAADWLWLTSGALGSLPFGEQDSAVEPWSTATGFESGKVQSAVGLDWERTAVSDWTDLVVPGTAGVKVAANRGQEGTGSYRSGALKVVAQAKALNLFGALGSQPVFSWYRTDVWTWATTASWGTGTRAADQNADGSVSLRSDLVLTPEESVALPVSYRGQWGSTASHSVRLQPSWALRRPVELPFELPRWLSPSTFRRQWVQDWGVVVDLGWQPTPSPVVRDLQVSWKGRLLLSEKSELATTLQWGQQWQNNLTVVGLEAAVQLVLNF